MNLENNGERMDIDFYNMSFDNFDIYQKSHFKRYEFAQTLLQGGDVVGDMACGSGYGTLMLSKKSRFVDGYDIDEVTINEIRLRYKNEGKVKFELMNLLDINKKNEYDKIVSFETIEHFDEIEIKSLLKVFHNSLKEYGKLIFSTPYNQPKFEASMKFHKTFYITERVIEKMVEGLFEIDKFYYQDYQTHELKEDTLTKDFIICVAKKIN